MLPDARVWTSGRRRAGFDLVRLSNQKPPKQTGSPQRILDRSSIEARHGSSALARPDRGRQIWGARPGCVGRRYQRQHRLWLACNASMRAPFQTLGRGRLLGSLCGVASSVLGKQRGQKEGGLVAPALRIAMTLGAWDLVLLCRESLTGRSAGKNGKLLAARAGARASDALDRSNRSIGVCMCLCWMPDRSKRFNQH